MSTIEWNKVTWYSKFLAVVLFVLTFYVGFVLGEKKEHTDTDLPASGVPTALSHTDTTPVIGSRKIKEANFTGTVATVSGSSTLARTAQSKIDSIVADFKIFADKDVPDMRSQFGADSPTAQYELDIDATDVRGDTTESIILEVYTYTGGAHGNSHYEVFTVSRSSEKMLVLSDIIAPGKQALFTQSVQKALTDWRSDPGDTTSPTFPDDVAALKFTDFKNWSLDSKNLTLYFDQYAIGPGALGAVAFPLPVSRIKGFLTTEN